MDALVAAYPQQGAVHEADSGTFAKQTFLYKYHKLHDHRLFQFREPIVRNGFGKQVPISEAYFVQIKMLEALVVGAVKHYHYNNYLGL